MGRHKKLGMTDTQIAEATADCLEHVQWTNARVTGISETTTRHLSNRQRGSVQDIENDEGPITAEELAGIVRKMKRGTTPEPDGPESIRRRVARHS